MARTKGPLFSIDASGTIAKTIVYSRWKGKTYVRRHQIPENPQTEKQVNVRKALTLLVALWQEQTDPAKAVWELFAQTTGMSGFNQFTKRGMKAYVDQLTTAVGPLSVTVEDDVPGETWTWTPVA